MPSGLDENKYKQIFENRFGAGSYNAGLSNARKLAELQVQADVAKERYKSARTISGKLKKGYTDSADYWRNADLKGKTPYQIEQEIRNDPSLQDQIKGEGYTNIDDYIDGMYAGTSGGQYRSSREYSQHIKEQNKRESKEADKRKQSVKNRDKLYKEELGMTYNEFLNNQQQKAKDTTETKSKKTVKKKEENKSFLGKTKDFFTGKDTNGDGERDGLLGFLDSTVGRASRSMQKNILGEDFVKKQDQSYKEQAKRTNNQALQQMQTTIQRKPQNILEKGSDIGGAVLGEIAPYVVGYGGADKVMKINKGLNAIRNPIGREFVRGGIAGGIVGTGKAVTRDAFSDNYGAEDYAKQIGTEALVGGGSDAALSAIFKMIKGAKAAKGAKNAVQSTTKTIDTPTVENVTRTNSEPLGLPAPQLQLPGPTRVEPSLNNFQRAFNPPQGLKNPIPESPQPLKQIMNQNRLEQQGLNFGYNTKNEPKPRYQYEPTKQNQQYWQTRYEDFAKHVNDNYDMNQMTPEALNDLWTQFAKYDEPYTLDQVIDLAYPKGFEAPQVTKQVEEVAPTVEQPRDTSLKDSLKADPKINQLAKNLFYSPKQEQKVSRLATPEEIQQNFQDLLNASKKTEQAPLEPLKFSRLKYKINGEFPNSSEPSLNRLKGQQINSNMTKNPFEAIGPSFKLKEGTTLTRVDNADNVEPLNLESLQNIKDIKSPQVGTTDLYRLSDRLPEPQKNAIQTSLDKAKQSYVKMQEDLTNDLYNKVVKGLGIKKGSKESALVQDYGEKTIVKRYLRKQGKDPNKMSNEELEKINLQQLKKVYPNDWEKIVKADQYFRENYNKLIDEVNKVRTVIYPNSPEKIVPKRTDYYHHFNELEGFEGIKNLFDTPASIDPTLEGISPFTKPKAKFQGFMQKRGNGKYTSDAVGGYLKYAKASSHSINVDPVIPVIRQTAKDIANATTDTRNANKVIEALNMFANDIAGKTNPVDRVPQMVIGRKGMNLVTWVNSRVKSNMILGNLGSALGQIGNVPLGVGKAKQYAITGLRDTIDQSVREVVRADKKAPIYQSNFIKERYSDSLYRRFDQKLIEQPRRLASWMMETAEKAGTRFVWNSMYNKGLSQKVADPIKYADYETRNIIAGRGVGEVPLFQKSKTFQVLAPFTLEVGNQWRVLKDMVGEKDAGGILTFLIASYGLNKAVEQVRGSGVSFDPIDALIEGYDKGEGDTKDKVLNSLASLNGEIIGNIPGGNLLTQFAGTDKQIPLTDMQYKDLFGERDPNRFGTGLTVSKALQDPSFAILPFGASQLRKSTKGLDAIRSEGVYKGDNGFIPFTGSKAELNYPVDPSPLKNLQMLLMGPNASSDAREYYDNNRRPLSEKQTNIYQNSKDSGMGQEYYNNLMLKRSTKKIRDQIQEINKNKDLSSEEKQSEIARLMNELMKLQQS